MQTSKLEAALAVALDLSEEDRRRLADLIYESLPGDTDGVGYGAADLAEWDRRLEAIESGRARTFSAEEVAADARRSLGP